ncbi:Zonular occludens toxin (Zot) [Opitutaceae bacterium TAV1]|nr:Zonular occludens toxin (Zot) [Opitutaceae bacterium TAV1]
MIHFLVGKPRNGKSLLAMMRVFQQLTTTGRYIVTNMVLDLDRLQALCIERGFPHVCVRNRVKMLTDEETKDFWLHRACGVVLPVPSNYKDKQGADVDYSPLFNDPRFYTESQSEDGLTLRNPTGTCYVIDEIHTHWPARGSWGTPRHVTFYNSQHGKLGDMCIFITQNTKLIDPNFIRLAQDFTYCRNHRIQKYGRIRGEDKFTAHTYPGPVENDREVTLNIETYKLDLPLAKCYDTSAGVGMPGGGTADGGERAKGIPLKMVWVVLGVVLLCVVVFLKWGLPKLTRKYVAPALTGQRPGSPDASGSSPSLPAPALVPGEGVLSDAAPAVDQSVRWMRLVRVGGRIHVHLTDGRIVTAPSLVAYDAGGVVDFVDLEGRGWRISRAPGFERVEKKDNGNGEENGKVVRP